MFLKTSNSKSESSSKEGIALITAQDILNLKDDTCLILVQGFAAKPIVAKSAMWFKDKNLKGLIEDLRG